MEKCNNYVLKFSDTCIILLSINFEFNLRGVYTEMRKSFFSFFPMFFVFF